MSKEQTFEPGDLAMCVAAPKTKKGWAPTTLRDGAVYTVQDVARCACGDTVIAISPTSSVGTRCEGCGAIYKPPMYLTSRFRKLTPPAKDRAELRDEQLELAK